MDITIILLFVFFLIGIFIAYWLGIKAGIVKRDRYWECEMSNQRKDAIMKSRAVLGGHFTENLAPYLPNFPFLPTECRFVGKPIDFICFKGMDDKKIEEVIFIEVKSGGSKLSSQEKYLKEAIEKKKVRFEEYRIPKDLTNKNDIDDRIEGFI
jgi:predicted Holliday junction resolvase-like endonuclease